MSRLIAQLTNPAVQGLPEYTSDSGTTGAAVFASVVGRIIPTAVSLGALALLVYFLLGAINWITAGGDKGKIESARNKIIQAATGFVLLVFMLAILTFLDNVVFTEVNILNIEFINQLDGLGTTEDSFFK